MTDPTEARKNGTAQALANWYANHSPVDMEGWPEDVKGVLSYLVTEWLLGLRWLPSNKKQKAFFIDGARQLLDAVGADGTAVLDELYEKAKAHYREHELLPPWFPPASPKSLVSMARKQRAERGQVAMFEEDKTHKYVTGKYADAVQS